MEEFEWKKRKSSIFKGNGCFFGQKSYVKDLQGNSFKKDHHCFSSKIELSTWEMSEEESRTLEKNPINQFLYQKSKSDGSDLDSSVVLMMIITSVEMEFLIHFVSNSDTVVQPSNI